MKEIWLWISSPVQGQQQSLRRMLIVSGLFVISLKQQLTLSSRDLMELPFIISWTFFDTRVMSSQER